MFVSVYWVILEQCVLSVLPVCYLSFSIERLLGYDTHKTRVKVTVLAAGSVQGLLNAPALCFQCRFSPRRKGCLLWRRLVLLWCSSWDESPVGMECEAFPLLIFTCTILRMSLSTE